MTGPAVVFTVVGQDPLREPARAFGDTVAALVAGPAEELLYLGFSSGACWSVVSNV